VYQAEIKKINENMDVTKIPFNQFIGLKNSMKSGYLLMLENSPEYRNHLDTVHASTLFALAEASSGYFLLNEFSEQTEIIPVVRKVETKYRKPASSAIFSKAKLLETEKDEILNTLNQRGRTTLKVEVSLFDETDVLVMQSLFEWFVSKKI
jgi:acyl-coenzyme A thioesterase PaaI-like protein